MVRHPGEGNALDGDLALIGGIQAREAVEQRGLAAAGWAHDGHHLAALHAQVDPAQRRHAHQPGMVNLLHPGRLNNQIIVHCYSFLRLSRFAFHRIIIPRRRLRPNRLHSPLLPNFPLAFKNGRFQKASGMFHIPL